MSHSSVLYAFLDREGIEIKPNFRRFIEALDGYPSEKVEEILSRYKTVSGVSRTKSSIYYRIALILRWANKETDKKDTSPFTTLYPGEPNRVRFAIETLIARNPLLEDIREIYSLPLSIQKSISSMCSGKGIPKKEEVKEFFEIFDDPRLMKDGKRDVDLIKSISSMCSGKGIPKKEEVKEYVRMYREMEQYWGNHLQNRRVSFWRWRAYWIGGMNKRRIEEYRGLSFYSLLPENMEELLDEWNKEDDRILSRLEQILHGTYKNTLGGARKAQDVLGKSSMLSAEELIKSGGKGQRIGDTDISLRTVSIDKGWDNPDAERWDMPDNGEGDPAMLAMRSELFKILQKYGLTIEDLDAIMDPGHENHKSILSQVRNNQKLMEVLKDFL